MDQAHGGIGGHPPTVGWRRTAPTQSWADLRTLPVLVGSRQVLGEIRSRSAPTISFPGATVGALSGRRPRPAGDRPPPGFTDSLARAEDRVRLVGYRRRLAAWGAADA